MKSKHLLLTLLLALFVPWAAQAQKALPYSYGFEDNDLSIDGWTTQNPSGLNASEFGINKNAKKTGNYGFRFSSFNDSGTSTQYLISPELSAPKGVNVSFYYKSSSTSSSGETFKVGYSTTNTDVSSFSWSDEYSTSSTSWSQLPEFNCPEGTKYIAIYYYPNYQYRLYIDDISLNVPPSCMKPTGLAATLTPGDGTIATLNWTAGGEETAWVLEYGTTSDFTGATSVNVNGTPTKNLTGLTAETKYYARVKADCGGGDTSEWSTTCEFTPTDQLIISILGTTGSTSSYLPSNTNYDYAYTQQIYTAEEMGSFPCTLKSVAFKGNKASVCNLDIYLANTTKSSFTGTSDYIAINEATLVFSGEVTFIANDWKTITFDNEFDYTGGNLAVIVDDNSGNYDYYTTTWQTFNTTTAQALYFYQDDTNINPSSPSADYSDTPSLKNQIKFVYELPSPYTKPQNLAVTNLTAATATITWEAPNSDVQSYKYQYREEGGTWTDLTSTTALSAPLTGLTATTTYEFQVQAIYAGNNESGFASKTFTTECDAYPIPYEYGFEDAADMDCWAVIDEYGRTQVYSNSAGLSGITAHTGDYYFVFTYYDYPDTDPQYMTLISPELTGMANGLHVEFYYLTDGGTEYPESFRVGYSTTNKNLSSFTWVNTITDVVASDYQLFKANYPANAKYVAVQHLSDDKDYLILDDFSFTEAPSCVEPSGLQISSITTTGAALSWTAGGAEEAWDIYVTDNVADVPNDESTPTYAAVTSNTNYPISSLTSGTIYYVYLRSACDATTHSDWTMPTSFTTVCEAISLPYQYDFEDDALPVCWNTIGTNSGWITSYISNSAPQHGNKHFVIQTSNYATGTQYVVLPQVDANYTLNEYEITFYSKLAGYSTSGRTLAVGVMTDPSDASTFVQIGDAFTPTTDYAQYKVRLNTYTGNGQYIAIKHNITSGPSSASYTYIDNLEVNPIPACLEPEGLAVSNETAHGATFSWTAGAATQNAWQLYFSKTNAAPADDETNVTDADSNPFTVESGLDAETNYYVWVRANCGGTDGFSIWVGPETFTTGIACPAPTGLAANNLTNHTADLSWNGTSESYTVSYRTAAYMSNPVLNEEFKNSTFPSTWSRSSTALTDDVLNGTTTINSVTSGWGTTTYGLGQYNVKMNIYSTYKYWLITPSTTIGTNNILSFDAAITAYNSNSAPTAAKAPDANSRFVVLITTDNQATWSILREWNNTGSADVLNNISNTGNNFSIDLSDYADETVKIAFYGGQTASGPDCDLHIDNVIIGEAVAAGTWQTVYPAPTASPCTITGLLADRKYEAKVQGDCGSEGLSQETTSIFFTTDIACPNPTDLQVVEGSIKSSQVDLTWESTYGELWEVTYWPTNNPDNTTTYQADQIPYTLSGLNPETEYTVKVRAWCGDDDDWSVGYSNEVTFSTIAACSAMEPVISNITHHNATVTWTGESQDGFTVNYRTAAGINPVLSEDFEDATHYNDNWTVVNLSTANSPGRSSTAGYNSDYGFRFSSYSSASTYEEHLINKNELTGLTDGVIEFYYKMSNSGYTETFKVGYSSTDNETTSFTFGENYTATTSWKLFHEAIPSGTKYVSIQYTTTGCYYYIYIDDIVIGNNTAAGTTQTVATTANTASLEGLSAGQKYDLWVVPNCDETLASEIQQFTTVSGDIKWFITEGNWDVDANWEPAGAPTINQDVVLKANATIASGEAFAKSIAGTGTGDDAKTLTIESGAKLKHLNSSVRATVKKHIAQHGETAGWYLIANPLTGNVTPSEANGFLVGDYDLYSWDYTQANEWRNYKVSGNFTYLNSGAYNSYGYLYANGNENGTDLTYTGTINAYTGSKSRYCSVGTGTYDFPGWYLLGNPYMYDAYLANASTNGTALPYYKMNGDRNGFEAVAAGTPIEPMEGFFYQGATSATDAYVVTYVPTVQDEGKLNMTVSQGRGTKDNAIIQFGEGYTLEKFSLNANSTKVYIPQDNKDYAVVNAEAAGEMPVNFKAEENGTYSLSFNAEEVSFSYLHLIDNMTGNDIDLLQTPSYTFNATTTDYESRFKLVFATGSNSNDDSFAFCSNGNWIINNEGEATLQVIDVNGRILSSETVNGSVSKAINAAPGVYMIRLINGENVKVQKVVIE